MQSTQKHTAKEQRQSDREAERRAVNGTLQAIRPESLLGIAHPE
jgi:hypothetical protein